MQSEEIKTGFNKISAEAGADNLLAQQINEKLQRGASVLPVAELKSLFIYFVIISVPTLLVYALLAMLVIQLPAEQGLEAIIEQEQALSWQTAAVFSDQWLLFVSFAQGVVSAFYKLLAMAFILTAAVMPVGRLKKIKGGLPCADC